MPQWCRGICCNSLDFYDGEEIFYRTRDVFLPPAAEVQAFILSHPPSLPEPQLAAQLKNKQMFLLLHSMLFNPTSGNSLVHSRATVSFGRYFALDVQGNAADNSVKALQHC